MFELTAETLLCHFRTNYIYATGIKIKDLIMIKELTLNEQIILLSIFRLKDNVYGVLLRENVVKITKKNMNYGTLYKTLSKLEKKGLISTVKGEPTHERGGRCKIYYTLTEEGKEVLQRTKELQMSLWNGIPDFILREF